jgi:WD40 repeat protein
MAGAQDNGGSATSGGTTVTGCIYPKTCSSTLPVLSAGGNGTEPWKISILDSPIGRGYNQSAVFVWSSVAWRPKVPSWETKHGDFLDGEYAIIVGGLRGSTEAHVCDGASVIMATDGSNYSILFGNAYPSANNTCFLTSVAWSPDGTHALAIGEHNEILKWDAMNRTTLDLWRLSVYANQDFYGRHVAYNPNGTFAVITGSDLLFYYPTWVFTPSAGDTSVPQNCSPSGTQLVCHDMILLGDQKNTNQPYFFDAIGWSPDSRYAIVTMGLTNQNGSRILGAVAFLSYDQAMCTKHKASTAPCVYTEAYYGKYEPELTDVSGVTFGPLGHVAWIYGLDDGKGTIMEYDEASDTFGYPIPWENAAGRLNTMAWEPNAYRVLYVGEGDNQLMESESWAFHPIMNNTLCGEEFPNLYRTFVNSSGKMVAHSACPDLAGGAWDPTGKFAIIIGSIGWVFRVEGPTAPSVFIANPADHGQESGKFVVNGRATSTFLTLGIEKVEYSVDNATWFAANTTPGSQFALWNFTLDAANLGLGRLVTIYVRATDAADRVSKPATVQVYLLDKAHAFDAPALTCNGNATYCLVANGFNLSWNSVGPAMYEVQESAQGDPTFTNPISYTEYATTFSLNSHANGTYYFRVIAHGALLDSEPSNAVTIVVTKGTGSNGGTIQDPNLVYTPSHVTNSSMPKIEKTPTPTPTPIGPVKTKGFFAFLPGPSVFEVLAAIAGAGTIVGGGRRRNR